MNVDDVFKKLTRGVKFGRTRNVPSKLQVHNFSNCDAEHQSDNDEEKEPTNFSPKLEQPEENQQVSAITLFGNMTVTDVPRKSKKRKASKEIHEDQNASNKRTYDKQKLLHKEEINRFRNCMQMKVMGNRIPEPIHTFGELNVPADLLTNLTACGYTEPTDIQKQAIPAMLLGRQLLACAPTGSGKTAAFLLPIIHALEGPKRKGFRAVIICPTRELAKQTQTECMRLSEGRQLSVHVMSKINKALTCYGPKSNQNFDVLVTTPSRLCYLLEQEPPAVSLKNVEWFIVDEADKLFEESANSFRQQLKQILATTENENRKIAMFSATYTPIVAKWCRKHLPSLIQITVGHRNAATSSVKQELLFVGNESGKLIAIRNIIRSDFNPPVLVFVQSKERAQQLYTELSREKVPVDAIHADRNQTQRDDTIKAFREGSVWMLICTELMARGIDFKGINLVINYDFPTSVISYVHRVGRAGRAGRTGRAITFFTIEDKPILRKIGHIIKESGGEVPEYILNLKSASKKEVKRLKVKAPKREDISVKVKHESKKQRRFRRLQGFKGKQGEKSKP